MQKRLLSILLAFTIVLTLLPEKAVATEVFDYTEPLTEHLYYISNAGTGQETKIEIFKEKAEGLSLSSGYAFEVVFSHPENIDKVYVTSTINNKTSYLEATAIDADRTIYRTRNYFNNDENYIPGTISIEYTKKIGIVPVTESWNSAWDNLGISGATVENISSGEPEENTVTCAISNLLGGISGPVIEASISRFEDNTGISGGIDQLKDWLGYYEDLDQLVHYELNGTQSDHDYIMYLAYPVAENQNYAMIIRDVTGNRYTKVLIKALAGNTEEIANQIALVNKASNLIYDYYQISGESAALQEQIDANITMTAEQRAMAKQKVNNLDKDRKLFSIMTTVLPLMVGAASGGAPALLFSALLGGITSTSNLFWEHRIGMIQACETIDGVFSDNGAQESCGIPLTRENVEIIYSDDWQGWNRTADAVIRESGKYYVTGESLDVINIYVGYPDDSSPALDVTICLHGKLLPDSIYVNSGSTLHLCDCKYEEHKAGSVSGGKAGVIIVQENNKLIVDSGILHSVKNNGGEVVISRAMLQEVKSVQGGKITINGGIFKNGVSSKDGGEIIINGGTFPSTLDCDRRYMTMAYASVWTDSGKITVNGGTIEYIGNETGEVIINGGQIGSYDSVTYGIYNQNGSVTINGGEVEYAIVNENGIITVSGGKISHQIYNGRDGAGGTVNINGGTVGRQSRGVGIINKGNLNIRGGTIHYLRNEEDGKITISKGTILNGIENKGTSNITISGGTVQGYVENKDEGKIIISGGVFKSDSWSICNKGIGSVIFFIDKNFNIEVNSKTAALFNMNGAAKIPLIEADTDYSGGVTYFHAPDSEGAKMTVQEAANIDYAQPYVCLVADGVTDRPSSGEDPGECEHIYSSVITAPTCTEQGHTTYTCSKCGYIYKDNYTNALGHTYGEWVITTAATSTSNGQRERICSRCNNKETRIIPAIGSGSSSGGSSGGSSSGGSSSDDGSSGRSYSINTPSRVTGGTVRISSSNAKKGNTVTITVTPNTGYELDKLTVTDSKGNDLKLTDKGNSKFTFTMPASKVSVEATFVKIEETPTQPVTPAISFTDISSSAYYSDAVAWAVEKGITVGTSTTTFSPDALCTRAQIVTFLWRAAGSPKVEGENPFNDVPYDSYYYDAVQWAMSKGITSGTSATTFSPDTACTRGQAVTFLYRYKKSPVVSGGNAFADIPDNAYYTNAIQWAVNKDVTAGTSATTFSPDAICTRGQIVTFLYRDMA